MMSKSRSNPEHAVSDAPSAPQAEERDPGGFVLFGDVRKAHRPEPGLYLVATPIGNLGDISLRALETLASADLVACEDTRMTRRLFDRYGIHRPMTPYHEHNAAKQRPRLLAALAEGGVVALVSDAGTPLVSDPGYRLVQEAVEAGHKVYPIPGASAVMAGLVVAGLPSDAFLFAGFLPTKGGPRRRRITQFANVPATLIFFESPNRVSSALADLVSELGGERQAAVARELTKRFETIERGTLGELAERFSGQAVKGEIVILIGPPGDGASEEIDVDAALTEALTRLSPSAAAGEVAKATGLERRSLYKRVLELRDSSSDDAETGGAEGNEA